MTRAVHRAKRPATGFTIMELRVATMVFGVVLLLVTAGIMQVARMYYKGVTEANTQNTARTIIDTISQAIQFSGGDVTPTPLGALPGNDYAFCVGDQQFTYRLGWQVENGFSVANTQTWHALVQNATAGCSSSSGAQDLSQQTVNGRDLM